MSHAKEERLWIDSKSYELAEFFLSDEDPRADEARIMSLAREIQKAVENWLELNP